MKHKVTENRPKPRILATVSACVGEAEKRILPDNQTELELVGTWQPSTHFRTLERSVNKIST